MAPPPEPVTNVVLDALGIQPTLVGETPIAHKREDTARLVAILIVSCFAGSLLFAFCIILGLVVAAYHWPETTFTKVVPEIDNLMRVLESVGTIFGSLLAFILGYYYGEARRP